MKWNSLPQPVLVRLTDLAERTESWETEAAAADAVVEHSRAVIGNRIEVEASKFEEVRSGFPVAHARAQSLRQQANAGRGVLTDCKQWIERLAPNTKLACVSPSLVDQDLAKLRAKLKALRDELAMVESIVLPASDLEARVVNYVSDLASRAVPVVHGYGEGEQLDVRIPAGGDFHFAMAALINPDAVVLSILRAVMATQTMPKEQVEKRLKALPDEIDALCYLIAALMDRDGVPPDWTFSPEHHLGCKILVNGAAKAVAQAIQIRV